jgi:hypothetical protein
MFVPGRITDTNRYVWWGVLHTGRLVTQAATAGAAEAADAAQTADPMPSPGAATITAAVRRALVSMRVFEVLEGSLRRMFPARPGLTRTCPAGKGSAAGQVISTARLLLLA